MTRATTVAGAVAVCAAALTGALAVASAAGWVSGSWSEALLVGGIVVALAAAGGVAIALVTAGVLRLATSLFAPPPPPGLVRIARIMEQVAAERGATGPAVASHTAELERLEALHAQGELDDEALRRARARALAD